jgi:hypothetical protein
MTLVSFYFLVLLKDRVVKCGLTKLKALSVNWLIGSSSVASSSTRSTSNGSGSSVKTDISIFNENDVGANIEVGDNRNSMLKLINPFRGHR